MKINNEELLTVLKALLIAERKCVEKLTNPITNNDRYMKFYIDVCAIQQKLTKELEKNVIDEIK